jgi:hypothetical protein
MVQGFIYRQFINGGDKFKTSGYKSESGGSRYDSGFSFYKIEQNTAVRRLKMTMGCNRWATAVRKSG